MRQDPVLGSLPPQNWRHSPLTGWTRAHWEHVADRLLDGVRPHTSRKHAFIHPPGRTSSNGRRADGLEGYARTFLLAAFRIAGAHGDAPGELVDRYTQGLRAGTDLGSDEAWPRADETPQAIVEASFVALALAETRPWIWDALDAPIQEQVVAWLASIHDRPLPPNNWHVFRVLVNAFLKSVDASHRQDEIDRSLDLVDSWHRCDGWYSDGAGNNFDYYSGWTLQLGTLLWCRLDGDRSDPARAETYRLRSRRFLEQYQILFAANGAPLYHGRSLIYRFATVAPLWAGALLDATPLPPGRTRRIASGTLRYFLERGATRNGVLTLGWHGEFTPMLQPYSGHGSPYWGSNGFLGLLLSPTHPVWSDVEEPAPIDRDDYCVALPGPGFVASGTCADGIVRATSHVSDHFPLPSYYQRTRLPARLRRAAAVLRPDRGGRDSSAPYDAHYRKLAYSTHTAPDLGDVADALDVDSQVALIQSESLVSRRARFHPVGVVDRFAASVFYPDEPRAHRRVETVAISHGECEIRIHHASTDRQERLRDGGFAIASDEPPDVVANDRWCLVRRSDGLTSCIAGLHALEDHGVQHLDGANAFGSHSAAPYVVSLDPIGAEGVFVSLNVLSGAPFDPDAIIDSVAVAVHGRMAVVSCGDSETYLVQLVAPEKIDLALGSKHLQGRIRLARVSLDGTNFTLSA